MLLRLNIFKLFLTTVNLNTLGEKIPTPFVMGFFHSKPAADSPERVAFMVRNWINSDKVVIFSKTNCPASIDVKRVSIKYQYVKFASEITRYWFYFQIFKRVNHKYKAIEIENRSDCDEIQEVLEQLTGSKTVSE